MKFGEVCASVTSLQKIAVLGVWSLFLSLLTSIEQGLSWFSNWVVKNRWVCYGVMWVSLGLGVAIVHQGITAKYGYYALCVWVPVLVYGILLSSILNLREQPNLKTNRYPCLFLLSKVMSKVTVLFGFIYLDYYLLENFTKQLVYLEACLYFHLIAMMVLLDFGEDYDLVTGCVASAIAQKFIIAKMDWNQVYPFQIVAVICLALKNILANAAAGAGTMAKLV